MVTSTDFQLDKDQLSRIGNGIFSYRSSAISADTEVTGLIHGASDHQGVAADSLIISNIIDGGDVAIHVLNGNDSYEALLADASARILYLGHGMNSVNVNADVIFPEASTISTTAGALTLSPATDTLLADGTGLVIGHTAQLTDVGAVTYEFQYLGTASADARMLVGRYSADNGGGAITFVKGRGAIGDTDIVVNGDYAGSFFFFAEDGTTAPAQIAEIDVRVDDATPANGAIGGRIAFLTSTTAGSVDERWRINSSGTLLAANSSKIDLASAGSIENIGASGFNLTASGIVDVAGVSGNIWSATQLVHKGSGISIFERTSSDTNALRGVFTLQHTTDGNMVDGFGTTLNFNIEDGGGAFGVGDLGFRRAGADNTGDFVVRTRITGSANEAFKVDSAGELYADLDGSSASYLTNGVNLFDDYDDPMELQRYAYIQAPFITEDERQDNRMRMLDMGVIEEKEGGSGYHLKIQTFSRLVAGGIYQSAARIKANTERIEELENELTALKALTQD